MWRMRVVHATGYAYKSPVTASYNEARLTPRSDSRQNVILNRVETIPATRSYRYVDYWGTAVTAFDLHAPHTELEVSSSSVVETDRPSRLDDDHLDGPGIRGGARPVRRGARPTDYTPASRRIEAVGKRIAKDHDPQEAVLAAARVGAQRTGLRPGHHRRALIGARRAARRQGRLPGFRAPDADSVARHGNSCALRVGIPAPQTQAPWSGRPSRAEPRLDPGVDGRLVELRPDQRHRDQRAVHQCRCRAATTPTCRR